jgi:hypothetical protein
MRPVSYHRWSNDSSYPFSLTLNDRKAVNQDTPKTITLYTLVTFNPSGYINDGEVGGIKKVVLQLCSLSLVDRTDSEGTIVRRSIQTELKRLLFPGEQ